MGGGSRTCDFIEYAIAGTAYCPNLSVIITRISLLLRVNARVIIL